MLKILLADASGQGALNNAHSRSRPRQHPAAAFAHITKNAFVALSALLISFAFGMGLSSTAFAQVPESISGTAYVSCSNPSGTADTFQITMPDGSTVTGFCLDHGLPAPANGTYGFTGTWNGKSYDIVMSTQGASILPGQIDIGSGCQRVGSFTWTPLGRLSISKESADPSITKGNALYSVEGATFSVYSDKACTDKVADLSIGSSGKAVSDYLLAGTYWVKETKAPARFALDPSIHQVEVGTQETTVVNGGSVKDNPLTTPLKVFACKRDAETGQNSALGSASLANAEFTIRYYDGIYESAKQAEASGKPTKTWVIRTNAQGTALASESYRVSGDAFYTDSKGNTCLPAGTLLVQETKAPEGYLLGTQPVAVVNITQKGASLCAYNAPVVSDQAIRGDLEFVKASSTTQQRLANVPFRITSVTTGESHIILTNKNGFLSTAASVTAHTSSTNGNDTASSGSYKQGCGIWFGIDSADGMTAPNDNLGALPFDTYRIEELSCSANKGLQLVSCTVTISDNKTVVNLGTIDDPESSISTSAHDGADNDKEIVREKQATIVDTVSYLGLIPGRTYRLEGTLMDGKTGQELMAEGEPITASTTFSPSTSNGSIQLTFAFDSRLVSTNTIVVFEKLTCEGRTVATHADLKDQSQTIRLLEPNIATTCTEQSSESHSAPCRSSVTLVDKVAYANLAIGCEYELTGRLVDVDTGEALLADGKEIAANSTFIPASASGEAFVEFTFDSSTLAGKRAVAFEEVSCEGRLVAEHKELGSSSQTVEFVPAGMSTSAFDSQDGDKSAVADKAACVTDRISYSNLQPGQGYLLVGILMDAETGLPVTAGSQATAPTSKELQGFMDELEQALGTSGGSDGLSAPATVNPDMLKSLLEQEDDLQTRLVTAAVEFTADTPGGTIEQSFEFDATELGGTEAVVYEVLVAGNDLIFAEADPSNEDQRIRITPSSIATEALDTADADHTVAPEESASITDSVFYTDLIPGKEYVLRGTLMNKKTGKPQQMNGKEITSQLRFTPNEPSGSVELEFTFDASILDGSTLVVFEDLLKDGVLVASHAEINDQAQTVEVGPGKTPEPTKRPTPAQSQTLDKTGATLKNIFLGAAALLATGCALYVGAGIYERRSRNNPKPRR